MVKPKTKDPLSSSSGAWLFLFMGVALLLLPHTLGYECKLYKGPDPCLLGPDWYHVFCVKAWWSSGEAVAEGCMSANKFRATYDFTAPDGAKGCRMVPPTSLAGYKFVCACRFKEKDNCNDGDFGEEEFKEWQKSRATTKAPAPGGGGEGNGSSSGLVSSTPLQGTFFAALLTLGAILGR